MATTKPGNKENVSTNHRSAVMTKTFTSNFFKADCQGRQKKTMDNENDCMHKKALA